jgi:hypothetical protein
MIAPSKRIDPCKEHLMKQQAPDAWISLNASYYIAPLCDPGKLLDDANLLLDGAHGITQSLSDLLSQDVDANPDDLANALWAASTLIQMGQRSAQEAHERIQQSKTAPDSEISPHSLAR